jgi:hypothetical protein
VALLSAAGDVDQSAILAKGIIKERWWPDVPTKIKSLIDEAADCGFEAVLYNTDHMGGTSLDGTDIPMFLSYHLRVIIIMIRTLD